MSTTRGDPLLQQIAGGTVRNTANAFLVERKSRQFSLDTITLYTPELGGFRHSDTVLVTGDGIEILTYYPRDLESLTI